MRIGLRSGATGADVKQLHGVLLSQGGSIERSELDGAEFGPSTKAALMALQERRGLPRSGEIDDATLVILIEIDATMDVTGRASRDPPPGSTSPDQRRGSVKGTLFDADGAALAGIHIELSAQRLRDRSLLSEAASDARGGYAFNYDRKEALNIYLRALDPAGNAIATSAVVFNAPAELKLDITTATDGVVRPRSVFSQASAAVALQLQETSLDTLVESGQTHELQFLANASGLSFEVVAQLYIAARLGSKNGLENATLFGIFSQGIPALLASALIGLPQSGIDDSFMGLILAGILSHTRDTLASALTAGVTTGVLPATFAATIDRELTRLDVLREMHVAGTPYIRGKTPLADLLAAGGIDADAHSAFVQAYAAASGRLGPTWKSLRAAKKLSKQQLASLNTTLGVGELLSGNLVLVKDVLQRLSQGSLSNVQSLALMDQGEWISRITGLDPQGASIAPVLTDESAEQRIARIAKALTERVASRYPTMAFAGGLAKSNSSSFSAKSELIAVITADPTLNLRRTNIDAFVARQKLQLSKDALAQLKVAQRLYRVSPHYASIEALNAAGYRSAKSIYYKGRAPFVAHATSLLGSAAKAEATWLRSQTGYATSLTAFGQFHLALNGTNFAAMASPVPPAQMLVDLPSMQALFGSLDYCSCSDCRSVYGPAAYLVDLLQFLKNRAATSGFATALDVLLARRSDLQYLALGCANTNTTLPYIDVVNELLESLIAPPTPVVTVISTTGTSAERRALPQQESSAAYVLTASAVFPLSLPFDRAFAATQALLGALGSSLAQCMSLCGSGTPAELSAARLGINPSMRVVINGSDAHAAWERWGFTTETNPPGVFDPKTRTLIAPADWIAALSSVPVFLERAALDLDQLYQLLEVTWVTQGTVSLKLGVNVVDTLAIVSCDTQKMQFVGLDSAALDRANRFLRLWTVTQLSMWELDWALTQAAASLLDDAFLVFLNGALALRDQLSIPLPELLGFWGPLPTRDVTNHLTEQDSWASSAYSRVFRSPTLLASWGDVFVAAGALSGSPIIVPIDPPPSAAAAANLNAIKAALGLSVDDIAAILAVSGAANALALDTLNVLLRHAHLAKSLSLGVPDLLLWIAVADGRPFGGTPADTAEFVRRLAVLQNSGFVLHDLDYLLRHSSATKSAVALTLSQATSVLQTIRDAVVKLSVAARNDASTVETMVVNALATALAVSADVISPLLSKSGALPLPSATVDLLLSQTAGVDPTLFPALVDAVTKVAKGAALFGVLQPSQLEFDFLIANAAVFDWLDPSSLPLAVPPTSLYAAFERLLQALRLNRRQPARSPKLFDVLTTWLTALPPDAASAISGNGGALGLALNASVPDLTALANAQGITSPSLTVGAQAGSLCDVSALSALSVALDAQVKWNVGATTLIQLAALPPTDVSATTAIGILQSRYAQSAWFAAIQPVEDTLRQARRDALVAYLLGHGPSVPIASPLLSSDDIFNYYLIDPQMCACGITTRLLEASLAVQQFVQQCFLKLVSPVAIDTTIDSGWNQWTWMKQFRLWQANRQVFLYPENYLLPELRTDKSPFFVDLENDLKQSNCDNDAAVAAFQSYLRKLVEVANLVTAAHFQETKADGSRLLHIFARTPRHTAQVVLPHALRRRPGLRNMEQLAKPQSRHLLRSGGAGHLGSAAALVLANLQTDCRKAKRPADSRLRWRRTRCNREDVLERRTGDKRIQRGSMAGQADIRRKNIP